MSIFPFAEQSLQNRDPKAAINDLTLAAQYYDASDVKKGWRGDAYLETGKLYALMALEPASKDVVADDLTHSSEFLSKARGDYSRADTRQDVTKGLTTTLKLTGCIRDSKWTGDPDCKPDKLKPLMVEE